MSWMVYIKGFHRWVFVIKLARNDQPTLDEACRVVPITLNSITSIHLAMKYSAGTNLVFRLGKRLVANAHLF